MANVEHQIATFAQQLGTVQNTLEESRRREEDLNTRLQQVSGGVALGAGLEETMNQMVATQQAILDATKKGDQKKVTLVDNRGLAKPSTFDGSADFLQWKIRLEAFVESVHEDLDAPMTWAEEETDSISNASIAAASGETNPTEHTVPELDAKNQQLCAKEAFTK